MKYVYVIIQPDWIHTRIISVAASQELADKKIEEYKRKPKWDNCEFAVEKHALVTDMKYDEFKSLSARIFTAIDDSTFDNKQELIKFLEDLIFHYIYNLRDYK